MVDGAVRDLVETRAAGFPVLARGVVTVLAAGCEQAMARVLAEQAEDAAVSLDDGERDRHARSFTINP